MSLNLDIEIYEQITKCRTYNGEGEGAVDGAGRVEHFTHVLSAILLLKVPQLERPMNLLVLVVCQEAAVFEPAHQRPGFAGRLAFEAYRAAHRALDDLFHVAVRDELWRSCKKWRK